MDTTATRLDCDIFLLIHVSGCMWSLFAQHLHFFTVHRTAADMNATEFAEFIDDWLDKKKQRKEGFIPELWDGKRPAWRALDVRYDQCVGHFECSPERDAPDVVFSVHLSCLQHVGKPGHFASEFDMMYDLYTFADSATRYWFLRWYDTYKRAHGRLPHPYWIGPTVPGRNATHDDFVIANRLERNGGRL